MMDDALPPRRVWLVLAASFGLAAIPWQREPPVPTQAWYFLRNMTDGPLRFELDQFGVPLVAPTTLAPGECVTIEMRGPVIEHPHVRIRWGEGDDRHAVTSHGFAVTELELYEDFAARSRAIRCVPCSSRRAIEATWQLDQREFVVDDADERNDYRDPPLDPPFQ